MVSYTTPFRVVSPGRVDPAPGDPFAIVSDEEKAEQRLLAELAAADARTIPAWTARDVAGVPQSVTNAVCRRLIDSGVVIHDTHAKTLILA